MPTRLTPCVTQFTRFRQVKRGILEFSVYLTTIFLRLGTSVPCYFQFSRSGIADRPGVAGTVFLGEGELPLRAFPAAPASPSAATLAGQPGGWQVPCCCWAFGTSVEMVTLEEESAVTLPPGWVFLNAGSRGFGRQTHAGGVSGPCPCALPGALGLWCEPGYVCWEGMGCVPWQGNPYRAWAWTGTPARLAQRAVCGFGLEG